MSMDMHEEEARIIRKEVIVQSGYLDAVFEECRHDFIYLPFGEDEIAHDNVLTSISFFHREPAPESKWSRNRITRNLHVQVIPRNVHFQYIRLVVTLLTDDLHDLLIIARDFLAG